MTIANVDMAKAWDEEGREWAKAADRFDAAGARHWQRFLAAVPIGASDDVLDVGCGCGQSTRDAARRAASGTAHGLDISAPMLEVARRRTAAEGLANVTFEFGDAQVHPFAAGAYDIAVSRFGAMFFADPTAAFANIGAALRSGGRLALLAWRPLAENEWLLTLRAALAMGRDLPEPPPGTPGPFGLSDADEVRATLQTAGFRDPDLLAVDEPICLGDDVDGAWEFVLAQGPVRGLTRDLDDETKAQALTNLRRAVEDSATDDGVRLGGASWIITATRP